MMFDQRKSTRRAKAPELFEDGQEGGEDTRTPQEKLEHRHAVLMECRNDEIDRQAEERFQMAIDEDFQDHLQWDLESASILIERGQTPLVFNEGRLTIEWICGTEKRARIDYKILPREEADEKSAEIKTKVVKYTDDVNLGPFHRSRAFRKAVTCGLGWLEESINIEPGEEIIYAGSVDWREVLRDSRSRDVDYNKDGRYLFRDKRVDLDYAIALLPQAKDALTRNATNRTSDDDDEPWYLGERLTSAHDLEYNMMLPTGSRDRSAYIGSGYIDSGRRRSVTLIEAWYKVPETVEIFQGGPFRSQEFDPKNPEHVEHRASAGFSGVYKTVAWRMRVMICTKDAPLGDWPSPFKHNKFTLVPVYGYRRARDGMCYGVWRGMRDPQVDLNKRMSKALWAASSNRVVAKKGAVEDIDEARAEAARPDMWLEVEDRIEDVRFEKPAADVQFSLELANQDRQMIRTVGGVTSENLGHDTNATSGKAILAKQDQGSMTTAELFEHYRLATQLAGQLRLSHIEQFKSERQVVRIVGKNKPIEWITINDFDEETGQFVNDITAQQADFIVSEQDYRASMQQAAAETMADILAKVAPFAPQAVINVLDLWVDLLDMPNKEEFVARIRKFNGQTDPAKKPTPEEAKAMQANAQKVAQQEAMQMEQAMEMLNELKAKIAKMEADAAEVRTRTLYQAIQAGQIVAQVPGVAPVADEIARGAGFKDQGGQDPNIPAPQLQPPAQPVQPAPELMQADGAMQGIETPQADGLQ